jgi:hypothetical protein
MAWFVSSPALWQGPNPQANSFSNLNLQTRGTTVISFLSANFGVRDEFKRRAFAGNTSAMTRWIRGFLLFTALLTAAGCSTVRVKVTGDRGVRYQAAWNTAGEGTQTRSGVVPASFRFKQDFAGWFQNATGTGEFRVRVYEGMGLLVDETTDGARRVVVERKGRGVSYRIE